MSIETLREQVVGLTQQLDWFKRHVFVQKSEQRFIDPQIQPDLLAGDTGSTLPTTDNTEAAEPPANATPIRAPQETLV